MKYNLNISYQKGKDTIVPNVLSKQFDFISNRPANTAKKIMVVFSENWLALML